MDDVNILIVNIKAVINHGYMKYRFPLIVPYINEAETNTPIRESIRDRYLPLINDTRQTINKVYPMNNPALSDSTQKKSCRTSILITSRII